MDVELLNREIQLLFEYWDGKISDEDLVNNRLFPVSAETDEELQKDTFY